VVEAILSAHPGRNRKQMLRVLGELLGEESSGPVIQFYETSVLALCRGDWSAPRVPKSCAQEKRAIGAGKIEVLANQITQFLLAGIAMKVHERQTTS
jgi:hypothetical protein